jgi:hypothetical protein
LRPPRRSRAWPRTIALARDPGRLIAWLLVRIAIGEVGLVVGLNTVGTIGTLVTIVSIVVLAYVALLAIHVLSLRIKVYPGQIHAAAFPFRRRYHLTGEPAIRLHPPPKQGWFRTQLGGFGIEIGLGRIREEELMVIRLAPRTDVVLVPCRETRLAVAPSSEEKLLRALEEAAQVARESR